MTASTLAQFYSGFVKLTVSRFRASDRHLFAAKDKDLLTCVNFLYERKIQLGDVRCYYDKHQISQVHTVDYQKLMKFFFHDRLVVNRDQDGLDGKPRTALDLPLDKQTLGHSCNEAGSSVDSKRDIESVYEHYQNITQSYFDMDNPTHRLISARLKKFSVSDLKEVLTFASNDDFYNSKGFPIALILMSDSKVAELRRASQFVPKRSMSRKSMNIALALADAGSTTVDDMPNGPVDK